MLGCGLIARAQIIQGATVTVENAAGNAITKGYKGYVEAGVGVDCSTANPFFEVTTTHGYQFQHLYLGLGIGLTSLTTDVIYAVPIFGEARWIFGKEQSWKPFAGIKLGYTAHLYNQGEPDKLSGIYFSPGFGVEYRHLTLSLSYLMRGYKYRNSQQIKDAILLRIGVNF